METYFGIAVVVLVAYVAYRVVARKRNKAGSVGGDRAPEAPTHEK